MHPRLPWKLALALFLPAAGLVGLRADAPRGQKEEAGFKELFNGKDLTGWKFEVEGGAPPEKTFRVGKDGTLVITGRPNGYLYTDRSFRNFVLRFDWRFNVPGGDPNDPRINSGCLVHIQPPHRVWPRCLEVQGMYRDHGKILTVSGAKGKFTFNAEALRKARKPLDEWNTTEVVSADGLLTSKVNGVQVAAGRGEPTKGALGFQSEGVELRLKNIRLRVTE